MTSRGLTNFPIRAGRFGDDFTLHFGDPSGDHETDAHALTARISRGRLSGTLAVDTTDFDAAGATTATCHTRTVAFTARSG